MNAILDAAAMVDQRILFVALLGALNLWAIAEIWLSRSPVRDRALWTAIVIVCPIIGCLFWFVLGPKAKRRTRGGS